MVGASCSEVGPTTNTRLFFLFSPYNSFSAHSSSLLTTSSSSSSSTFSTLRLPHPNATSLSADLLWDGRTLYELQRCQRVEGNCSAFIDDYVMQDGSVILGTPFDPLFYILHILHIVSEGGWMTLETALEKFGQEGEVKENLRCVLSEIDVKRIERNVADVDEMEDGTLYKLNVDKVYRRFVPRKLQRIKSVAEKGDAYITEYTKFHQKISGSTSSALWPDRYPVDSGRLRWFGWQLLQSYLPSGMVDDAQVKLGFEEPGKSLPVKRLLAENGGEELKKRSEKPFLDEA